jgi:hypothetical protein
MSSYYAIITNWSLASNSVKFFNRFRQMPRQQHVLPSYWQHVSILIKKINKNTYFFLKKLKFKKKNKKKSSSHSHPFGGGRAPPPAAWGWHGQPLEDPGPPPTAWGWPSGTPRKIPGWPDDHPRPPLLIFFLILIFFIKISIFIYFLINLYFFY